MSINLERIAADIETIAGFSESPPAVGHSRPTFSEPWRAARDYVIAQAAAAGCTHRMDAAGNVFIRPASIEPAVKLWLSGSHIDSVPTGGQFDGVIGIVAPLEVLRGGPVPLELVIWAEEEGSTFGLGMIGSRLATGAATPMSIAAFTNRTGQNYLQAGAAMGVRPEALASEQFQSDRYRGLIEIHAEQGPAMWAENVRLAVVTAIAGRLQFKVAVRGQANHVGSTPMSYRHDALVSAAKMVVAVQQVATDLGHGSVATVGRIECEPNAINVIPGAVRFTVDLRSGDPAKLAEGQIQVERALIENAGPTEVSYDITEHQPVMPMDLRMVQQLIDAGVSHRTVSGALHDAAILAPLLPTAMLFVASKDGISHNPAEVSRIEDIAAAAEVLRKVVTS